MGREAALTFAREGALVVGCGLYAEDAEETVRLVRAAGGTAVLTDPALPSGSDRVLAALGELDPDGRCDVVVNLQGDMPFVAPAVITACLGVWGGIRSKTPAQRLPRAWRTFSISSVSRASVPLTIRKTRSTSSRRASSATASAAGLPNTTSSIRPKMTRPD